MCAFVCNESSSGRLPLRHAAERHGLITSGKLLCEREPTSLSLMVYHRHLSALSACAKKEEKKSTFDSFASLPNVPLRGSEAPGNRFHFDFTAWLAQIYPCIYNGVVTLLLLSFSLSLFLSFSLSSFPSDPTELALSSSVPAPHGGPLGPGRWMEGE